jgi:hypothetical protein
MSAAATAGATPARRRLWQLPATAHDLLLATSFAPDTLRREAERVLGRLYRVDCSLEGCDADLLYSVVHDMATRNSLSEALHARLDERHAAALQRHAGLRDADALRESWGAALDGDDLPGSLWAVLTHRHGAQVQERALYDARARIFAHARQGLASGIAERSQEARLVAMTNELVALRARMLQQQRTAHDALERLQAEAARLTGEVARWRSAYDTLRAANGARASWVQASAPARTAAADSATQCERRPQTPVEGATPSDRAAWRDPTPRFAAQRDATARAGAAPDSAAVGTPAAAAPVANFAGRPTDQVAVRGRRVLCVGGIRRAVARYRARIERAGGRFDHHDGGIEDGLHALDGRLERADLVICQAGCINHEAYHRVKRFCERRGTPCLYIERPSLTQFELALRGLEAQ